ncbi:hypothetical protein NL676_032481 [Syzygium grande]|nr:hypothetical protein NL676_032481 [Syzygium grande]
MSSTAKNRSTPRVTSGMMSDPKMETCVARLHLGSKQKTNVPTTHVFHERHLKTKIEKPRSESSLLNAQKRRPTVKTKQNPKPKKKHAGKSQNRPPPQNERATAVAHERVGFPGPGSEASPFVSARHKEAKLPLVNGPDRTRSDSFLWNFVGIYPRSRHRANHLCIYSLLLPRLAHSLSIYLPTSAHPLNRVRRGSPVFQERSQHHQRAKKMEVYRAMPTSPSSSSFSAHYSAAKSEPFDELAADFEAKLGVSEAGPDWSDATGESAEQEPQQQLEGEDGEDDGDSDFEFACLDPGGSPVSADDVFDNGRIRPFFPLFDRSLVFAGAEAGSEGGTSPSRVKRVFAEAGAGGGANEPRGTYCEWTARIVEETPPSPGSCRKSNSTGSSKLWRFRDLLPRSNSDGRDAVVMLSPPADAKPSDRGAEKARRPTEKAVERKEAKAVEEAKKGMGKGKKATAPPSAHEMHYVKSRAVKESEKRKSYLPYRRDLLGLGFFTSVNGLSKNLHPF